MKNLMIGKKLMISYAVILVLLVMSILVSIFNLASINSQVETFYKGPFTVKGSANIVNTRFEQMQILCIAPWRTTTRKLQRRPSITPIMQVPSSNPKCP